MCTYVHPCARMCIHVHACACTCLHVHAYACICIRVPACASMCMHVRPCACMCVHVPAARRRVWAHGGGTWGFKRTSRHGLCAQPSRVSKPGVPSLASAKSPVYPLSPPRISALSPAGSSPAIKKKVAAKEKVRARLRKRALLGRFDRVRDHAADGISSLDLRPPQLPPNYQASRKAAVAYPLMRYRDGMVVSHSGEKELSERKPVWDGGSRGRIVASQRSHHSASMPKRG